MIMAVRQASRMYQFNRCIFWEKNNKGRYFGLNDPLFDACVFFFPWIKNDGNRGFVEWLIFRFGWYPVPPTDESEIGTYDRKILQETYERR
jgi:hypothetical protein